MKTKRSVLLTVALWENGGEISSPLQEEMKKGRSLKHVTSVAVVVIYFVREIT
jgi:hypothetical protein